MSSLSINYKPTADCSFLSLENSSLVSSQTHQSNLPSKINRKLKFHSISVKRKYIVLGLTFWEMLLQLHISRSIPHWNCFPSRHACTLHNQQEKKLSHKHWSHVPLHSWAKYTSIGFPSYQLGSDIGACAFTPGDVPWRDNNPVALRPLHLHISLSYLVSAGDLVLTRTIVFAPDAGTRDPHVHRGKQLKM